jgi:hypothetical protein
MKTVGDKVKEFSVVVKASGRSLFSIQRILHSCAQQKSWHMIS